MLSLLHDLFAWAPLGLPAFVFVITFVVFFHELGHYLVARACGVSIETFSIGFGSEIFGWTDRKGTRWKVSWLPFGGYVKFLGDADAASTPDRERVAAMDSGEKSSVLLFKPLYQRALIAVAGPAANFILAFVVFTVLFTTYGAKELSTYIGAVQPRAPAAVAGIKPGDKIIAINGERVHTFYGDLMDTILSSKSKSLSILIDRNGRSLTMDVTPGWIDNTDVYGAHLETRGIGVSPAGESAQNTVYIPILAAKAPLIAMVQTWRIVDVSLVGVWRMVSHRADASQLTGVIGIAGVSQKAASQGLYDLISLIAFISVSIGLINLFPIPLLDGGHLLYYGCEAVLGRPLGERVQDVGFRVGLALVVALVIFAAWNDLVR
ncbi:MAG: RIP metalloprotease RseP [Rhizomicrobium sp.]